MDLHDELRTMREHAPEVLPAEALETMGKAAAELAESGLAQRAVNIGAQAPDFTLPSADGREVTLSALLADGHVVLTFYRGAWCPFCNIALRHLQLHQQEIAARGARLVAVSPQVPDESLSLAEKQHLDFDILSDIGSDVAKQYGIAFDLSDELGRLYDRLGFDLQRVNSGHARTLPLPATYVIDRDGTVRWAFVDTDYTRRAEASDILAALG